VAEVLVCGWLNAPVDSCWSFSNSSCSSFGRRGGAGLGDHAACLIVVVVKVRLGRRRFKRSERARGARMADMVV